MTKINLYIEALKAVEWVTREMGKYCPWCENSETHGHTNDCQRQRALDTWDHDLDLLQRIEQLESYRCACLSCQTRDFLRWRSKSKGQR